MVIVPKELVWDYSEPPRSLLWRLQRIADFFPAYGSDRETVRLLFDHLSDLEVEEGKSRLIALYHEVWNDKTSKKD
ncbi:MAG: hypothetical protein MUO68_10760 [Desulfobacteraceae bacterium]|nr:hypothetical protein [Desulfobacteraceae bacterium]